MESLSDEDSTTFALRIQQTLRDSRVLQKNLEAQIRKTMKKHGEERRFVAITPPDEVVKGYPDIELKWMFGKKEVVIPKAMSHRLLHGWKKWREDAKMDLKRSLLEDSELGKKYVADRQVILARKIVVVTKYFDAHISLLLNHNLSFFDGHMLGNHCILFSCLACGS